MTTAKNRGSDPDPLTLRRALLANLYEPLPVRGKAAVADGWAVGELTPDRLARDTATHPQATNTGLRTGALVGVDIDVEDEHEAAAIKALVEDVLGPSPLVRVGRKGMLICYQNPEPIRKITVGSSDRTKVEIMGVGQQVVAYGVHPDTARPYEWIGKAEPASCPRDFLPVARPGALRDLAKRIATILSERHPAVRVTGDTGEASPPVADTASQTAGTPLPPEEIAARLFTCDPSGGREAWRDLAASLAATPCTDLAFDRRALFVEWSRGGGAAFTGDEDCEAVFDTMPPKAGGLGAGSFIRLTNAAGYRGPTVGKGNQAPAEVFGDALAGLALTTDAPTLSPPADAWAARVARFQGREPDEDADLPEPEFWDDEHILPKFPDGCIGVAYGPSGAGKTMVVTAIVLDAALRRDARVAYLAGEGAYGLGKMRIPALCEAHGVTPRSLRGKYRTIPHVLNLLDPADADALIEAQRDFRPDVLVIDTLATALPGADENAAATGSLLTGNGPAGRLRDAFRAAVIFVAHSGKAEAKGVRGSSAFTANVDFVWKISANKEAGTARLQVEKMKDGPDGFSVFYRIAKGVNGVPVALRIPETEYRGLQAVEDSSGRREVRRALQRLARGSADDVSTVTTHVLATALVPPQKGQNADDYERLLHNEGKRLQRLARQDRKSGAAGILADFVMRDRNGEALNPVMWKLLHEERDDGFDGGNE